MDSYKCTKKCLGTLQYDQFTKIKDDASKRSEGKIQTSVRKLKTKITKDEFSKV